MNTQTPQEMPAQDSQHVLEERLKVHIKREFDLGEKVISLLKQKKTLETDLQEQFQVKGDLEYKLEDILASKRAIEEQFAQMQRELREQQKALRRRSRRIIEDEEGSREDLKTLRQEIQHLRKQLEILDTQKVEEHVQLSNKIQELCGQETTLKQELQKISYQKEVVEEELDHAVQKFQTLAVEHDHEKTHYEQQIELLQRKQAQLEIQIAHLLDEQRHNEHKLQQEIDTLKHSKAQLEEKLEEKLEHLRQRPTEIIPDSDLELRQLIAEKEKAIQELETKAHQRSAMLRAENANLKQEVHNILTAQEKITWENQMLESSLKGLQNDLAEYLQLKNKFAEVQQEKEHFEATFYKKMKFLEARYQETDAPQTVAAITPTQPEPAVPARKVQAAAAKQPDKAVRSRIRPKRRFWRKMRRNTFLKVLIPALALSALIGGLAFYTQFPWRSGQEKAAQTTLANIPRYDYELPEEKADFFKDDFAPTPAAEPKSPSISEDRGSPKENTTIQKDKPKEKGEGNNAVPAQKTQKKKHDFPRLTARAVVPSDRPIEIVVQLSDAPDNRSLAAVEKPLPSIANNLVLRRHYEQKLVSAHK